MSSSSRAIDLETCEGVTLSSRAADEMLRQRWTARNVTTSEILSSLSNPGGMDMRVGERERPSVATAESHSSSQAGTDRAMRHAGRTPQRER